MDHEDRMFENIESEVRDGEYSPPRYDIVTYPADYTLKGIVDKFREEKIIIPDFQRRFVWTHSQASKLIESFLLGLPVPPIFLYTIPKGKMWVVDGQQRLRTIAYFWEGFFGEEDAKGNRPTFRLSLSEKSPYNGATFKSLEANDETSFEKLCDAVLRSFIIKQLDPKDDTSIMHIFERLNTGGTPLVGQEVRNCIFNGPFNDLLLKLNSIKEWREIVGKTKEDKRQRDVELVLRFFALLYDAKNYGKPMKEFLNTFMQKHMLAGNDLIAEYENIFTLTIQAIRSTLGAKPFHIRAGLNVAAFDAVAVAFAKAINKQKTIANTVKTKYKKLIASKNYEPLITASTTDEEVVSKRLKLAHSALFGG